MYWLELVTDTGLKNSPMVATLSKEADEITAMVVASIKSTRRNWR